MNYFNSFIGGAQVINGFMGQGLARQQADLAIQASEMEQSALKHQADMARIQAKDVLAFADEDVFKRQQATKQMLGSQKVAMAAQGIVVEGEIGQALADDEQKILREDSAAIKNNAWRSAFGLEIKATDFENKAAYSAIEARGRANDINFRGNSALAQSLMAGSQSIMKDYNPKKTNKIPKTVEARNTRGFGSNTMLA